MGNKLFKSVVFIVLISISISALSAPLYFVPKKIKQPNGQVVNCFISGDEFYSWLHDADGYTIVLNEKTKYYAYAILENKVLKPSEIIVGQGDPKVLGIPKWLTPDKSALIKKIKTEKKRYKSIGTILSGNINNVVIFITFSDDGEFTDNNNVYDGLFNSSPNSFKNYYLEASYSKLNINTTFYPTPSGSTVISYHDSHPRNYYLKFSVDNPTGYQPSEKTDREQILLKNAIDYVKSSIPVNLNLDENNDGDVDNVCFMVKGSSEAWSDLLWPHMYCLYSLNDSINGKRVYNYNFQLSDYLLGSTQGVGVLAHEFFHTIGAPDLYHYAMDGRMPVGDWDIMQNPRNPPQHMAMYMKYEYGKWLDSIPEIRTSGNYYLKPNTSNDTNCYKIKSPKNSNEYYVLEYRKKSGIYESNIPSSGLLVFRVNKNYEGQGNTFGPPDELFLYRKDGSPQTEGIVDSANLSKNTGRVSINDGTTPSGFLSDGSDGGLDISDIGAIGNVIQFKVNLLTDTSGLVLRSPNGGQKWAIGSQQNIKWVASTLINKINIKYSYDKGITWDSIVNNIQANLGTYSWTLPLTPLSQCKIKIERSDNLSVIDTSDYYFDIVNPNSGLFYPFGSPIMPTKNFAVVVSDRATILCSYNGGATWESKCNSGDLEGFANVCFSDSLNGIAVGGCVGKCQINRTFDGGKNWVHQNNPEFSVMESVKMIDNKIAMAVGIYGKIIKTTDGGLNWIEQNSGTTTNLWGLSYPTLTNAVAIGSNGLIIKSTDGGSTWYQVNSGTTIWLRSVSFCNANYGMIVGLNGLLLKTTDGGTSWTKDSISSNNLFGIYMYDQNNATAVGQGVLDDGNSATLLRTTNGGASWFLQDPKCVYALNGVYFYDMNNGLCAGYNGTIIRTTNSGLTWERQYGQNEIAITSPKLNEKIKGGSLYDIKWIADTVWVNNIAILFSSDSGTTWTPISNWTYARYQHLAWNPPNISSNKCMIKIALLHYNSSTYSYTPNDSLTWVSKTFSVHAIPTTPALVSPASLSNNQNVSLIFTWYPSLNTEKYKLQVAEDVSFSNISYNDSNITNTSKCVGSLKYHQTYYWHVKGTNTDAEGDWSDHWNFTTKDTLTTQINSVENINEYMIAQNQPNPFNAESIIKYNIPVESQVKITVYNLLGLKITELLNTIVKQGSFEVKINSKEFTQGIYFYKFEAKSTDGVQNYSVQKKFIVTKE